MPGGIFLSITFAQPHFRRPLLLDPAFDWGMIAAAFGPPGGFQYFVYALRRGSRTEKDTPQPFRDGLALEEGTVQMTGIRPLHSHMDDEDYLMGMDL